MISRLLLLCMVLLASDAFALLPSEVDDSSIVIDDTPRQRDFEHPDWFKMSFLDIPADLEEAIEEGKQGLVVYFGQKNCAYCEALMNINFKLDDIVSFTQQHFNITAIDIWGSQEVTTINGDQLSEKEYAIREKTNFTPSLIFYDKDGIEALRLRGYYKPYKFRAALKYVADGFYKQESFREYLLRANPPPKMDQAELNKQDFFSSPPYMLDRTRFKSSRPLLVMFEQGSCHACDIMHGDPLTDGQTRALAKEFEIVQLDMWSEMPVLTPDGRRIRAREWAEQLGLFYAPTLIFFDEAGKEIIRVDSVTTLYRLRDLFKYVLLRGYEKEPTFVRWRLLQPQPELGGTDLPQIQ